MHERSQRPFSIRHICSRHSNGVWQALCVDCDVALYSRYLLAGVIPLVLRGVRILDALCINDAKRRLFFATKADAGRANLIFLTPAPAGLTHLPMSSHSSGKSTNTP